MNSARRAHVVILVENLPVPLDRRVWLEATTLAKAGYEVTVIGPRGAGDMGRLRERRDGVRILRYPQRAASGLSGYVVEYLPSMVFTLAWLVALRALRPIDVIHGCNPPDLFFVAGRLGALWGATYVFDQHDANPELAVTKWPGTWLGRRLVALTRRLEKASYDTAALVLAPNDSYAALARTRGNVAPERVVVVRNAPSGGRFRELVGDVHPEEGVFRIGYLGVMGSQDGVEFLIDATAELVRQLPDVDIRLELVGDGEARIKLEARAAAAGVGHRTRFHGYLRAEEFVPLLASAHVCVSPDPPTPFNDVSTMTKVVEYLAIGRPVVAYDLTETRQLIGDAGQIVPEGTADDLTRALRGLIMEPATLQAMAKAAETRLDELDLSWEQSSARLLEAYHGLVAPATTSTPAA